MVHHYGLTNYLTFRNRDFTNAQYEKGLSAREQGAFAILGKSSMLILVFHLKDGKSNSSNNMLINPQAWVRFKSNLKAKGGRENTYYNVIPLPILKRPNKVQWRKVWVEVEVLIRLFQVLSILQLRHEHATKKYKW